MQLKLRWLLVLVGLVMKCDQGAYGMSENLRKRGVVKRGGSVAQLYTVPAPGVPVHHRQRTEHDYVDQQGIAGTQAWQIMQQFKRVSGWPFHSFDLRTEEGRALLVEVLSSRDVVSVIKQSLTAKTGFACVGNQWPQVVARLHELGYIGLYFFWDPSQGNMYRNMFSFRLNPDGQHGAVSVVVGSEEEQGDTNEETCCKWLARCLGLSS